MIYPIETEALRSRNKDSGMFSKVVLIDTISYCNLKCSMCMHKTMTRAKGIMKWELFQRIIDEIAQENKNVRVWMSFFGEALILTKANPSIFDMISYAKAKGLTDVVLNSNGNLLNNETAEKLIQSGIDAIYVGVDAWNKETYGKLRVGGDYKSVFNNVINLINIKGKSKLDKPSVFVQFVEMEINKYEKEAFVKFWNMQGVKVKIRPKVSWGGGIDSPNLIYSNRERYPCHWAMQTMSISHAGEVVLCAVDLDAKFITGDVNRQSLKEIWNGKLKELRRLHILGRFEELPVFCRDCRDWQAAKADYFSGN